jgi:hypothetical protein
MRTVSETWELRWTLRAACSEDMEWDDLWAYEVEHVDERGRLCLTPPPANDAPSGLDWLAIRTLTDELAAELRITKAITKNPFCGHWPNGVGRGWAPNWLAKPPKRTLASEARRIPDVTAWVRERRQELGLGV